MYNAIRTTLMQADVLCEPRSLAFSLARVIKIEIYSPFKKYFKRETHFATETHIARDIV